MPIWDADVIGSSFICCTTASVPQFKHSNGEHSDLCDTLLQNKPQSLCVFGGSCKGLSRCSPHLSNLACVLSLHSPAPPPPHPTLCPRQGSGQLSPPAWSIADPVNSRTTLSLSAFTMPTE